MDQRLRDMDARIATEFFARDRAVELAAGAVQIRLEHLNEARLQILSDRSTMVPRDVYDVLVGRVVALENATANVSGRFWAFGVIASTAGAFLGMVFSQVLRLGWK